MSEPISERAKALYSDESSVERKLCFAASDYIHALNSPEFAAVYGGLDSLLNDLLFFVDRWRETI